MSTLGDGERSARLRVHIRAQLAAGKLPVLSAHYLIYAGYGEQQLCSACGERIERDDVLYEVEVTTPPAQVGADAAPPSMLSMHLQCFELWVAESRAAPGGQPPVAELSSDPPARSGRRRTLL